MRAIKAIMILNSSLGLESVWGALGLGLNSGSGKDLARKPVYGVTEHFFFPGQGSSGSWNVSSSPGARRDKIHVNLLASFL